MKLSSALFSQYRCILIINIFLRFSNKKKEASKSSFFISMERVTGLEPATVCLEGRNSSQLSYTRISTERMNYIIFPTIFKGNFHLGVAGFELATFWSLTLKWPSKIQISPILSRSHLSRKILYKNQSQIQPFFKKSIFYNPEL